MLPGLAAMTDLSELVGLDEVRVEARALVAQPFIRSEEEQFLANDRSADASCELPELIIHSNWRSFDAAVAVVRIQPGSFSLNKALP